MRHAQLWIVVALMFAAVALGAGCSVQHRSGDFACVKQSDCNGNRQCVDGFCIIPGSIDAPHLDAPRGDGNNCPAGCTSCDVTLKTCTIDCSMTNCNSQVTCPMGYKCDVQCKTDSSCRNGVSCVGATSCTVECSGKQSCQNVTCGIGACDISCSGNQSCSKGIQCSNSCQCDVTCTGLQSCTDTIQCTAQACHLGLGCTSVPLACHTACP